MATPPRSVLLLIAFCLQGQVLFSQLPDTARLDNNPRLTVAESAWLNDHFSRDSFDFTGKYVAYSQLLTGGFYGIGKFMLPLPKKNVFNPAMSGSLYHLYILTEEERKLTNGYDAIFIFGDKRHKGKMRRLKRETVIADHYNRYPQLPPDAGVDNNPALNAVNAEFFNEIYKMHPVAVQGFNFSGKKVAIFNTQCRMDRIEEQTIASFVQRVRRFLDMNAYYSPEFTYLLTEEQKKESGGYDVIIQYRCKVDIPLQVLISKLKKGHP